MQDLLQEYRTYMWGAGVHSLGIRTAPHVAKSVARKTAPQPPNFREFNINGKKVCAATRKAAIKKSNRIK